MHHGLRWFSPDTDEVATQYLPQEVGEITYYLKGWCKDEEQWIQVIDDKEMPVTWNIKVRDWDFQAFIDSIAFRRSGDENGILITGKLTLHYSMEHGCSRKWMVFRWKSGRIPST